jgi:hypothetical protein
MPIVIVPNTLRDAITAKLDAAYVEVPEAEKERELHYQVLLDYFYEHGVLPDFTLVKKEA